MSQVASTARPKAANAGQPFPAFDLSALQPTGFGQTLFRCLFFHPQPLLALLRVVWPVACVGRWAVVTRFDDVQEVFCREEDFPVPFARKIMELNNGPNFLLGMPPGREHADLRQRLATVFLREDIEKRVAPLARDSVEARLDKAGSRFDAIPTLLTAVPVDVCRRYYGVDIPEDPGSEAAFANWALAMSAYLFADPTDRPKVRELAVEAAANLRDLVRQSVEARDDGASDDVAGRALAQRPPEGVEPDVLQTMLIGMIVGFVPTNTLASGHMLDVLLDRPEAMDFCRARALADDDEGLCRGLFEAMRFKPLNPGPFRAVAKEARVGEGGGIRSRLRPGSILIPSTQSAMLDRRRIPHPRRFDPGRSRHQYMLFGYHTHRCAGDAIAEAQITQTFKSLLRRGKVRRASGKAGKLSRIGPFPASLHIEIVGQRE